jgi:hypothetical protein
VTPQEAEAVYAAALGRVAALREQYGPALGERLAAGLAERGPGYHLTPEERARRREERHPANAFDQRRERFAGEDERPPTYKQRQLLWCLGYRGPRPRTRAEVAALVEELQAQGLATVARFGPKSARARGRA